MARIQRRYMEGSASTTSRETGFLDEIKQHLGIQVISDKTFVGSTQAETQTKAMQRINLFSWGTESSLPTSLRLSASSRHSPITR